MQIFRADNHEAELVGWGVRVVMVSDPRAAGTESVMRRVSGFGGLVDHQEEMFAGIGTEDRDQLYRLLAVLRGSLDQSEER